MAEQLTTVLGTVAAVVVVTGSLALVGLAWAEAAAARQQLHGRGEARRG